VLVCERVPDLESEVDLELDKERETETDLVSEPVTECDLVTDLLLVSERLGELEGLTSLQKRRIRWLALSEAMRAE